MFEVGSNRLIEGFNRPNEVTPSRNSYVRTAAGLFRVQIGSSSVARSRFKTRLQGGQTQEVSGVGDSLVTRISLL